MLESPLESVYRDGVPNEQKPILLFILPLLLLGFIAWPFWAMNRPPFALSKMEKISPGMSKAEILAILPEPTYDEGTTWTYSRKNSWSIMYLYFDGSDRFLSSEYDR